TPLFFSPKTSELFVYNKMMLIYGLTIVITGSWVVKSILNREFIFKKTPLDIPIFLFLISQVLSTFFSIDRHTSIWGYYSRSNGGLLSIISYTLLFYAFVSNFDKFQALKFLKSAVFGGFLVSLYAIPEHFGFSPSCLLLNQTISADCWIQDVQARVFATLGQPNWLAAYLAMLFFPVVYFFLTAENLKSKIFYYLTIIAYYLAFTFTYSRGGTLGLLGGLGVFLSFWLVQNHRVIASGAKQSLKIPSLKPLIIAMSTILVINLLLGSALTGGFSLIPGAGPNRPVIGTGQIKSGTQLETGGTESGTIRLIVWEGALNIFKAFPVFGSGTETFAYSYYQYRPAKHNLVSEWDFLYNKAHNEYLNYLATTGLVGFLSYLALILGFILFCIRYQISSIKKKVLNTNYLILNTVLLAGYISYLNQNIFSFSVVIIATLFYLFPAFAFVLTDQLKEEKIPKKLRDFSLKILNTTIYRRDSYPKIFCGFIFLICFLMLFKLVNYWNADTLFNQGSKYSDSGNPGKAYNLLYDAVALNKKEPLYRNELGYAAASAALALEETDSTTSAQLK
ncbi:MAG: O-antigen ligase family protein, partial [Nanoarchaeota archaeon]